MYQVYQVGLNDNLEGIATKFGISKEELKRINGLANDNIVVGSYIIVPNKLNNNNNSYITQPGDTMYSIAKKYNVDLNTLLAFNGLNKNDYIYPNQEILIPKRRMYITKENEKVIDIINKLNIDPNKLSDLYLVQDQVIEY